MKFKTILAFCCLVVNSCSISDKPVVLPEPYDLNAKERKILNETFPIKIEVNNEKLIVVNSYVKENVFTVYNIHTMDSLYSFGNIGKSNSEFGSIYSTISDDVVEVMDMNKIKYVDIQDSCAAIITSTKPLPLIAMNTFGKINDSLYYTSDKTETNNKELMIFNIKNDSSKYIGERPQWAENDQQGCFECCVNSQRGTIASFYNIYPEFKIMDFEGKTIRKVKIKIDHPVVLEGDISTYFIYPIASDNFIYATWIDKAYSDITNQHDNMQVNLLVIDWDGTIRANYRLQGRQRVFFVKDDAKLYTFSTDNKAINEYDLPKIN